MAMIFGGLVFFVGVIMKYLSLELWAARNIEKLIIGEDSSMTLLIHGTLLEIRSAGQAVNVAVNMIFTIAISQVFLDHSLPHEVWPLLFLRWLCYDHDYLHSLLLARDKECPN
ncbi:hypothetical protein CRYUN_Cryun04dG0092200 [Craigia yunnanensis]